MLGYCIIIIIIIIIVIYYYITITKHKVDIACKKLCIILEICWDYKTCSLGAKVV